MGFVHRALYTWFVILVFLILLCLRLESRTHWNWFSIFIPLWIYDGVLLIYICIKILTRWRNVLFRLSTVKEIFEEYRWSIGAVILMLVIQFNICLVLEYPDHSIFLAMCPVWILLSSCIIFLFYKLISTST